MAHTAYAGLEIVKRVVVVEAQRHVDVGHGTAIVGLRLLGLVCSPLLGSFAPPLFLLLIHHI